MKRELAIAAACLLAVGLTSAIRAEEAHNREGGGYARTWVGTFDKSDAGKLVFKYGHDIHLIVAGEKASDQVKAELANAEKELIGQGTFQVAGIIRKDGDVVTIHANTITKKGDKPVAAGGERK